MISRGLVESRARDSGYNWPSVGSTTALKIRPDRWAQVGEGGTNSSVSDASRYYPIIPLFFQALP